MAVDAAAYAKAVNAIIADRDRLSAEALRGVLDSLQGARKEVMDRLAAIPTTDAGTWQYYQLQQARKGLEGALTDLGVDLSTGLTDGALAAFRAGAGMTSAAVLAGGDAALAGRIAFGQVSTLQAVAIARHYPELVKGLTDRAIRDMGQTLQRGMLTGRPAHAIMGDLRKFLDVPERGAKRFGGLAYQVDRLYTTEVNRIFAAGTEMGYARTAEVLGTEGMVRVWQHSGGGRWPRDMHIKLHGTSAPYPAGVFDVNGNPGRYPHAPELPAGEVINCRCGCLQWNMAWGPVGEFGAFPPGSDAREKRGAFREGEQAVTF